MPEVKNLVSEMAKNAATASTGQPTVPQAAPPTASTGGGLAVPSVFGGLKPITDQPVPEQFTAATSYVFNASSRSGNWQKQKEAGLNDGEFALCLEGNLYPLRPLKYFVLQESRYMTTMNASGDIPTCSKNMDDSSGGKKEHYLCLILVMLNDRIIPAKAEFRSTKSRCASDAVREIHAAASPDWIKSDAHRVAASFAEPWMRVVFTAHLGSKRTGPNGDYIPANPAAKPTTSDEFKTLINESSSEEFKNLFTQVLEEYKQRYDYLEKKAVNR